MNNSASWPSIILLHKKLIYLLALGKYHLIAFINSDECDQELLVHLWTVISSHSEQECAAVLPIRNHHLASVGSNIHDTSPGAVGDSTDGPCDCSRAKGTSPGYGQGHSGYSILWF